MNEVYYHLKRISFTNSDILSDIRRTTVWPQVVVNDETKGRMQSLLSDIQSGAVNESRLVGKATN